EYTDLKTQRAIEIEQAEGVSKRANTAFTEIDAQKKIAETLASEDKAIHILEEMAKAGVIPNVYGRLRQLVKIREEYSKAAEAAAAGWLNALVVKDVGTAVACIEILKKNRIGRVKLIPLEGLSTSELPHMPNDVQGLVGPLTDHMTFDEQFRPAINHVFGDTTIALTSFFLSGKAVDQLRNTLISLEGLTRKAKEDVEKIERELQELTKITIQTENFVQSTGKEIANSQTHLQRTHKILDDTELRIQQLTREIGTEQTILQASS